MDSHRVKRTFKALSGLARHIHARACTTDEDMGEDGLAFGRQERRAWAWWNAAVLVVSFRWGSMYNRVRKFFRFSTTPQDFELPTMGYCVFPPLLSALLAFVLASVYLGRFGFFPFAHLWRHWRVWECGCTPVFGSKRRRLRIKNSFSHLALTRAR